MELSRIWNSDSRFPAAILKLCLKHATYQNLEQRQLFPGSHLETVSKTCNMAESGAATADSPCIYLETTVCLNHAARIEVEELMG